MHPSIAANNTIIPHKRKTFSAKKNAQHPPLARIESANNLIHKHVLLVPGSGTCMHHRQQCHPFQHKPTTRGETVVAVPCLLYSTQQNSLFPTPQNHYTQKKRAGSVETTKQSSPDRFRQTLDVCQAYRVANFGHPPTPLGICVHALARVGWLYSGKVDTRHEFISYLCMSIFLLLCVPGRAVPRKGGAGIGAQF